MRFRRLREYCLFLESLFRINIRLLWGMWKLTKLPQPAITVFGGSRIPHDSIHAKMAMELSKKLAADGFSIITGGGPGIMEAANQGAIEHLKECHMGKGENCFSETVSAGIGLIRLNMEKANPYVQENIVMSHFFARKWLLVRYSVGFAIFPGGFGTMDELFEIITLVQCNRMERLPIVLVDSSFWYPLVEWIDHRAVPYHLIMEEDKKIITIVDTVDQAFEALQKCKSFQQSLMHNGVDQQHSRSNNGQN